MPDASPTGAKNDIVSSTENHRRASCGAVRPGFDLDKVVRAQSLCMRAGLCWKANARCNGLAQAANRACIL